MFKLTSLYIVIVKNNKNPLWKLNVCLNKNNMIIINLNFMKNLIKFRKKIIIIIKNMIKSNISLDNMLMSININNKNTCNKLSPNKILVIK